MAFIEKVVPLNTTDTLVYECPAMLAGSVHGLVFSNVTNAAVTLSIKLFTQATGLTVTITGSVSVAANSQFTWPKPINITAGDKIIATGTTVNALVAIASVYTNAATPASAGFVARGNWSSLAGYAANDIVSLDGITWFAVSPSTNSAPPSVNWVKLSDRGVSVSSVVLDSAKHLIVNYSEGAPADLGLFLSIDSVTLDASKHLIVTYSDATTADLGLVRGVTSAAFDGSSNLIITYSDGATANAGFVKSIASTAIVGGDLIVTYNNATTANLGVVAGYTHPTNHPASIITQDASNRFVTDAEKAVWNAKQEALNSGSNIKTVNGLSLVGSGDVLIAGGVTSVNGMMGDVVLPPVQTLAYTSRATLRSQTPAAGEQAIVDGLGLFVFAPASTEPDDDESAFATTSGVWLLQAAHWDLVDAWQLPEVEERAAYDEDEPLRFAASFAAKVITGTATCAITSVANVSSTSFTGTVTGAAPGDRVIATPPAELGATSAETGRLSYHAWVSAANTVTVMLTNASAATASTNPAIRTAWPITVIKS